MRKSSRLSSEDNSQRNTKRQQQVQKQVKKEYKKKGVQVVSDGFDDLERVNKREESSVRTEPNSRIGSPILNHFENNTIKINDLQLDKISSGNSPINQVNIVSSQSKINSITINQVTVNNLSNIQSNINSQLPISIANGKIAFPPAQNNTSFDTIQNENHGPLATNNLITNNTIHTINDSLVLPLINHKNYKDENQNSNIILIDFNEESKYLTAPFQEKQKTLRKSILQDQEKLIKNKSSSFEIVPDLPIKVGDNGVLEEESTTKQDENNMLRKRKRIEPTSSMAHLGSLNGGGKFCHQGSQSEEQWGKPIKDHSQKGQIQKQKNKGKSTRANASLNYFDRIKIMSSIKPKIKFFFENFTLQGRTSKLNDTIRSYINDSSDYHTPKKVGMSILITKISEFIRKVFKLLKLNKIPMFNPESKIKIIFNSIIVTYSLFYLFLISLQVFFSADFGSTAHLLHYIAMGCWITEMVLEMNTSCYHSNIFITDRKIIMKIYLKEYFFFEILPLIFEGMKSQNLVINILLHLPLLLKIKGMMINLEKLEFYILQLLDKQHFFQLFKLIMQMLLLSHIVACLWNCALQSEIKFFSQNYTWVEASHIIDGTWWKTYLYAQYWAFTTMKNVGTIPNTVEELVFTSFCMVLSCIAFGYLLNAIGLILADITKNEEEYKKDLNILNSFMKRKNIDLGLKRRVNINLKSYYEQQRREKFSTEKDTLNKLNQKLIDEVIESSSKKILQYFPFFENLFSDETINKLYGIMEEVILSPSQIVYDEKNCFDETFSIYLIVKGSVLYYAETQASHEEENYNLQTLQTMQETVKSSYQKEQLTQKTKKSMQQIQNRHNHHYKKKVKVLGKGQSFGILGFFTGKQRVLNVQSNEYSTVIKIERKKFIEILQQNQNDYEKFMEIKDKLMFDQNYTDLNLFCYICGNKDHLSKDCTKVHFNKDFKHIFYKFNCSIPQERNYQFKRTEFVSHHARQRHIQIQESALEFKKENSFMEESGEMDFIDDVEENEENNDTILNTVYGESPKDKSPQEKSIMSKSSKLLNEGINMKKYSDDLHQFDNFECNPISSEQQQKCSHKNFSEVNQDTHVSSSKRISEGIDNIQIRPRNISKNQISKEESQNNDSIFEEAKDNQEFPKKINHQQKLASKRKCSIQGLDEIQPTGNQEGKKYILFPSNKEVVGDLVKNIVVSLQNQIGCNFHQNQPSFTNCSSHGFPLMMLDKQDCEKLQKQQFKAKGKVAFNSSLQNQNRTEYVNSLYSINQTNYNSQHSNNNIIGQGVTFLPNLIRPHQSPHSNQNINLNIQNNNNPNSPTILPQNQNQILRQCTLQSLKNLSFSPIIAQTEQQNFLWKMDCLKNYTYFYPHFNIQNVIKKYNFAISKKKRQKRRAKTIGSEKGKKVKGFYLSSKNELNSQNLLS